MEYPINDDSTAIGTVGGTLLSIAANISTGDMLRTAVLAAVGALVSFAVSVLLKLLLRRIRKK